MPKTKKEKDNKSQKIVFKRDDIDTVQQSSSSSSSTSVVKNPIKEFGSYIRKLYEEMQKFSQEKVAGLQRLGNLLEDLKKALKKKQVDVLQVIYVKEFLENEDSSVNATTSFLSNETLQKEKFSIPKVKTSEIDKKKFILRVTACQLLKTKVDTKEKSKEKEHALDIDSVVSTKTVDKLCDEMTEICKEYYGYITLLLNHLKLLSQNIDAIINSSKSDAEKIDGIIELFSEKAIGDLYVLIDNFITFKLPCFQALHKIIQLITKEIDDKAVLKLANFLNDFGLEINKPMQFSTRLPMLLEQFGKTSKNHNADSKKNVADDGAFIGCKIDVVRDKLANSVRKRSNSCAALTSVMKQAINDGQRAVLKAKFQARQNFWKSQSQTSPISSVSSPSVTSASSSSTKIESTSSPSPASNFLADQKSTSSSDTNGQGKEQVGAKLSSETPIKSLGHVVGLQRSRTLSAPKPRILLNGSNGKINSVAISSSSGLFSPKRPPRPVAPSTPPTLPIKTTLQANTSANFKQ